MNSLYLWLLILPICTAAQQDSMDELLRKIETNNKQLSAFEHKMEGEILHYKSTNKLPDPQASAYFLPFGETEAGHYTEFEISQRMEFPSVYSKRKEWINQQSDRLNAEYRSLRQDILLRAKKLALQLIYLDQQYGLIENRIEESRQVYHHVQQLYEKGQTGILELNKAKVAWLDQQFALEELKTERIATKQQLESLNGGQTINLEFEEYPGNPEIVESDTLWEQKVEQDPSIQRLEEHMSAAAQQIELERSKKLPDLSLGFNHQGVPGNNIYGFFGGISIPLWSHKYKVDRAKAQHKSAQKNRESEIQEQKGTFNAQYDCYQLLNDQYDEYRRTLEGLQSDSLLRQSYELGEISFLEYYREIQFYREAKDRMNDMKHTLYELKSILTKHQL